MSNIRRKTAEHLSHAWNAIPHVTQHDKADITDLEQLRQKYAAQADKAGGKLTLTAIALKVVAGALRRFPQFNASVDMARHEIIRKHAVHVGVAVDTERGLLVPVVRDVDRKGILELSVELATLSEKARAGKLTLDEMQDAGRELAGGRDSRHLSRRDRARLGRPAVPAAVDAAAVALVRPPGDRRRRRRALPALGCGGVRAGLRTGAVTCDVRRATCDVQRATCDVRRHVIVSEI
jgi:hypothetical protein